MSWSDPEPQPAPRPVFRAGLSLVGSAGPGETARPIGRERGGQGVITALPFGTTSGTTGGHAGQGLGQGLGLGQRLSELLAQRFDQFERFGEADTAPAEPVAPLGKVRPVVFSPFGGDENEEKAAAEIEATAPVAGDLEVVEPEEPAPPPIDYEALKAEAWSEGFRQGYDEGKRLAAEEQKDTTIRLGALLHDIVADTEGFVRELEADVVELVLGVAEKVIGREARLDPRIVVSVVRSALNEIHDATEVRIRAHPDDVAILEPRWQEMLPRRVAERSELLADEAVERGGVVVETQIGYVDSQLKTRLQQVVNTFQAVLDGEPV